MNKLRLYTMLLCTAMATAASAQNTPVSQMERLDRGVVALSAGSGNFVSWRFLGTDDENTTTFDLLRNGTKIASDLYATNYTDKSGKATSTYQVVTKVNGEVIETSTAVQAWGAASKTLQLNRPAGGSTSSGAYTYSPNDMSVGDVDGDGQYELFLKWDPSNSKDNSQDGVTGNVIIDCYKVDWSNGAAGNGSPQLLWRVDLGQNIRAGAHYTQYMVYDFDGDGKAEMMCKTAPGSKDSKGNYVNQATDNATIKAANNTKSWITSSGRMDGGHEYLTVFNGQTGEAVNTIAYNPNRNATSALSEAAGTFNWAIGKTDTHGYNRGDRYLAGVGYIDGPDRPASGIFCRGYYSYAFIWAVSFDGQHLIPRWFSEHRNGTSYSVTTYDADGNGTKKNYSNIKPTRGSGSGTMFANGNHNMSMADVDGDGCDEIIWGSAALDHDGTLLYGTGFGHGDAIHLGDHCPDRPGLELFQIHEEGSHYGWDLHDAATGQIIHSANGSGDNGRGIAGQFDANVRGSLFWSSNDGSARSAVTGDVVSSKHGSSNFRIYWDGDLQDELLDGNIIDKWNGDGTSRLATLSGNTCNSTKNTPNLQADILGDWREEVILHNGSDEIYIYSTNTETGYRVPTLMHDHTYRMGICWQNVAYNQPPHLGYYLPDAFMPSIDKNEFTVSMGEEFEFSIQTKYAKSVSIKASFMPDGTKKTLVMPTGMSRSFDSNTKVLTVKGTADQEGDYRIAIGLNALGSGSTPDTLVIHSVNTTGIETVNAKTDNEPSQIYDLQGRKCNEMRSGEIYIIRQNGRTRKVVK